MRLKPLIIAVAGLGLAAYLWPTYELFASMGPLAGKPQTFYTLSSCNAAKAELVETMQYHVWGCDDG